VAYAVAGVTGLVMAGAAAQGKTWGVIGGLVMSLLILGLSWTPYLFLVFAATSVCSGFFALASLLLLGVSLPQCIRLNKDRAAFQREIDQT
jgi:nicotinamide riboside transporter PnuC